MVVGMLVALLLLSQAIRPVIEDKREQEEAEDKVKRLRWMVMLGVVLAVTGFTYDFVQTKVYDIMIITSNEQHVANVFWAQKYRKAITG